MARLPETTSRNLEQDRSRIRHPLARLRKFIHGYVGLEGLGLSLLFLALWFWIGLLLDYGIFKLTLVDWVQTLPWGFRLGVLVVVLSALLALLITRVFFLLFKKFSDPAMALVLEKRFPDVLGDRLITAVEMSNPDEAAQWGYSPALVRETIHEAADRVDQVPVGNVFDWARLRRQAWRLLLLTLGLGLVSGAGFCAARAMNHEPQPVHGFSDFAEVATIWTERNVLLQNTIWPRRAYLEVLPWERTREPGMQLGDAAADPASTTTENLRIPQNTTPPPLRVRAWKYVLADSRAREGWRLLSWADLPSMSGLAKEGKIPTLPEGWQPRDANAGMTVDEVELLLENFGIRQENGTWMLAAPGSAEGGRELQWSDLNREKLGGLEVPAVPGSWDPRGLPTAAVSASSQVSGDPLAAASRAVLGPRYIGLSVSEVEKRMGEVEKSNPKDPALASIRQVFDRLKLLTQVRTMVEKVDELASDRASRRMLRKLVVPGEVSLEIRGLRSSSSSKMSRGLGNEYTGSLPELKESVTFTVRGEDYISPQRSITVVERPRVETLESMEERPAYLYYRPGGATTAADLRGKRQPLEPMRLSVSGETTTLEVPAGTNVNLRAAISKPVKSFALRVDPKDQKTFQGQAPVREDDRTVRLVLPDLRREQRFTLAFEDTDEVVGERKIVIQPKEDANPRVREFNPDDVIRRGRANEGYVIAVGCRIPFKGRIQDDHGLSRVRYACRVIPADFLSEQKVRALLGVSVVGFGPPSRSSALSQAAYLAALNQETAAGMKDETGPEQMLDLPAFAEAMASHKPGDGQEEFLGKDTLESRLKLPQREPYRKLFREFPIVPDRWIEQYGETEDDLRNPSRWFKANESRSPLGNDLPLWKLVWRDRDGKDKPLKDPDDTRAQKRFLIEVRLLAEDTFLDGEVDPKTKEPIPHISPSGETFTFAVVPENELLSRIAEEEEAKYRELQKSFKPLPENLDRVRDIHFTLGGGPGGIDVGILNSFIARCDSLSEVLKVSHQDARGVYSTYERILKEMRVNQVREDIVTRVVRTIYIPLMQVSETQFDRTINSVLALRRTLDTPNQSVADRVAASAAPAAEARKQLNDLVSQLNAILAAMEGLSKLNELISELARIEKQEEDLETLVSRLLKKRIKEELDKLND